MGPTEFGVALRERVSCVVGGRQKRRLLGLMGLAMATVALTVAVLLARSNSGPGDDWPPVDPERAELSIGLLEAPEGEPVQQLRAAVSSLESVPTSDRCEQLADELTGTASPDDVMAWAVVVPDQTLGDLVLAERAQVADLLTACVDDRDRLVEALDLLRTTDLLISERLTQLEEAM